MWSCLDIFLKMAHYSKTWGMSCENTRLLEILRFVQTAVTDKRTASRLNTEEHFKLQNYIQICTRNQTSKITLTTMMAGLKLNQAAGELNPEVTHTLKTKFGHCSR